MLIFSDDGPCRRRRSGCGRRDREGDPGIPARCPICIAEFAVGLQIEISLHIADRKQEPDLGTDANTWDRKQPTRSPEPLSQPISL